MKIYRYFKRIFMSLLNIVNLENDIVLIILNGYTVIENIEICVYWNINHFIYIPSTMLQSLKIICPKGIGDNIAIGFVSELLKSLL